MYKNDFLCNPKHIALMMRAIKRIYDVKFNEDDIRFLLLGVRAFSQEVADTAKSSSNAPTSIKIGYLYLSDICHSIAHPEQKTQGPIRSFIKKTDEGIKKSTEKMRYRKVLRRDETSKIIHLAMPPHQKPIPSNDILIALLTALETVTKTKLDRTLFLSQSDDILLCIFSIMHFVQIPLYDETDEKTHVLEKKAGYLGIQTWEGFYHLHAGVLNSEFETIFTRNNNKNRSSNFINTFPVMHSNKLVENGIHMDIRSPTMVVANRDESGSLVLQQFN